PPGCAVDTPLPTGLSLAVSTDGNTCTISGTPETTQAASDYIITATNATANATATVSIAVVSGIASFAVQTPLIYIDGTDIVEQVFANTNTDAGRVTSCVASLLPTGLQIAAQDSPGNGCVLTGTPNTVTAQANYTVTATNDNGDSTLMLDITINPVAPALQTPSAQSFATGAAVNFDLTNTGGGHLNGNLDSPPGCAVDTPLPTGLSLAVSTDGNTCTISGTSETAQSATDYVITATNATANATATVSIAVVSGIAAFATPSPLTYIVGTDIGVQVFANTNTDAGRVTSCTASLLPTGLQIAAQDSPGNGCVLTGTPNTVTAQATYTITVTNDNGDSTLTLDITVNPAAPALQTPSAQSFATGAAVSFNMTNTGGGHLNGALDSPPGCAVDTALPAGLSLAVSDDDSTCTITGTP
ncbi:MAG: putative Ig domain-containing protein, partial [Proteobacteria bacterium]|nr:putative Ig domain-containing protein [Pseudomonadota bacterium]